MQKTAVEKPPQPIVPLENVHEQIVRKKKMSPLECFRQEVWIDIQAGQGGWEEFKDPSIRRGNPYMNAEFHAEVHRRFEALSEEEKLHFDGMSIASSGEAYVRREQRKRRRRNAEALMDIQQAAARREEDGEQIVVADDPFLRLDPVMLPVPDQRCLALTNPVTEAGPLCPLEDVSFHVQQYVVALGHWRNKTQCVADWTRKANTIATDKGRMPQKITYNKPCSHRVCRSQLPFGAKATNSNITDVIVSISKRIGCKYGEVPLHEVMVAIELWLPTEEGPPSMVLLGLGVLGSLSARSGNHPPTYGLLQFVVDGGNDQRPLAYHGRVAQPVREPFIESTRESAVANLQCDQMFGALAETTEEDVLAGLQAARAVDPARMGEVHVLVKEYNTTPSLDVTRLDWIKIGDEARKTKVKWKLQAEEDSYEEDFVEPAASVETLEEMLGAFIGEDVAEAVQGAEQANDDEDYAVGSGDDGSEIGDSADDTEPTEYETICRECGVQDLGGRIQDRASGEDLGTLYVAQTTTAPSIRTTCSKHEACSLFMYARVNYSEKLRASMRWLRAGSQCDAEAHAELAREYKIACGITPRRVAR